MKGATPRFIRSKAYNGLLEELVAGEKVLHATSITMTSRILTTLQGLEASGSLIAIVISATVLSLDSQFRGFLFNVALFSCILG